MGSDRPRTASQSERECFDDCRAKWHLYYVLGKRPERSHPGRRLGSLFEVVFAALLRRWALAAGAPLGPTLRKVRVGDRIKFEEGPSQLDPLAAIRAACAAEQWPYTDQHGSTEDAAELALALAQRAYDAMGFPVGRWRPVVIDGATVIQSRLTAPLPFPADSHGASYYSGGVAGVLDLCALDGERAWRPVLCDTKVRGSLTSDPDLGCDPQLGLYQYLLRHNGVRVYLCEQWEVLAHVPEEPPLNKDRKAVSRDQEYRATRETFLAACRKAGVPPGKNAEEHMAKLDRRRWEQATPGGGTDAEVDDLVREFTATADLMAALAETDPADWPSGFPCTRNLRTFAGSSCRRCDSQSDCWSLRAAGRPLSDLARDEAPAPIIVDELADLDPPDEKAQHAALRASLLAKLAPNRVPETA